MKRLIVLLVLAAVLLPFGALAKENVSGKKIVSSPCIMSYTDFMGNAVRVIRSNPITIVIK